MARLGQIITKLNIGVSTAEEFLNKKGMPIEDGKPNQKLSPEQEKLLVMEYGDENTKKELMSPVTKVKKEEPKTPVVEVEDSIEVSVPHQLKIVDKVDLDNLNKKQTVEENTETPEVSVTPKKEEPVSPAVEEVKDKKEPQVPKVEEKKEVVGLKTEVKKTEVKKKPVVEAPKKEDKVVIAKVEKPKVNETATASVREEISLANRVEVESNIKVVGKIDLSTINNSTRPSKKSKEEKRKERISNEQHKKQNKPGGKNDGQGSKPQGQGVNAQNKGQNNAANADKKKRKRIGVEKIDINKTYQNNNNASNIGFDRKKKPNKSKPVVAQAVSEEDVAKQVRETLARLTEGNKTAKKGARYRKDKREANVQKMQAENEAHAAESTIIKLTEFVTASELAVMMNVQVNQIIQTCFNLGLFVSINQRLDAETINIVAEEFGFKTEFVSAEVVSAIVEEVDTDEMLETRPPIITVMGHVDHGKTSLLDYIRKANVIAGEAGGITQHIGAYNVLLDNGQQITFLDTPGHEAFTAMRARGAKVTDIAIIIIAADDNIKPQTVEAINHASAAGVPIVFAINKCDKPGANPDKVKESLSAMNYLVEEWGGKYQSQDISAKTGLGVNDLLDKVLLEAEMLELKANPNKKASGSIIESTLDKGRGYTSTLLVSAGTLKVGDILLAGTSYGKVKAMFNERNQRIKEAGPSMPVMILGMNGAPQAGDNFNVFSEEHEAREIANKREQLAREQTLRTSKHLTLDEIGRRIALGNFQELNVIVKGDVDGSIEALSGSLLKLSTEEIQVNVIHKAVGQISESDVMLATASNAIIIGFQVRPSVEARKAAEREEIDIRLYSIIYDAIEELKLAMEGMLAPEYKEEVTATIEIRETFKITKVGTIAGCMVKEGKVKRSNKIRLIRDGIVVFTGELASLKRMKDDVKEVSFGYECGLNIANYNDIKIGDIIEAYEVVEVKKTLK